MSSELLRQVVDATRGEYVVHGTLGRSDVRGTAFLARDVAEGQTVVLVVPQDAESLDVVGALGEDVPADAGACAACGFRVATWVDACPRCEQVLAPPPGPASDPEELAARLRGTFQVLGGVPHVWGGTVYFGHAAADGRLTAFVVRPQPDAGLGLEVVWEALPDVRSADRRAGSGEVDPGADGDAYADGDPYTPATAAARWRRLRLPVGVGLGVVAAVAGVAVAVLGRRAPARAEPVLPPPERVPAPAKAPSGPEAAAPPTTSAAARNASASPGRPADNVRPAAAERRRVHAPAPAARAGRGSARLTIEGRLPANASVAVGGEGRGGGRELRLVAGRRAVVRIKAAGYCPATLAVTLAPNSHHYWAPTLYRRPASGRC